MLKIQLNHLLKNQQLKIRIEDNEPKIYAIKGPSGIGKTTLLNMIAGLRKPNTAFIQLNGHVICDTKQAIDVKIQKRNIGYLFQDYQLFPNMDVYHNITFMTKPSQHIDRLLQQLNIVHLKNQYPLRLSGGEAQRVALARALSTRPDLILLDEPFSSLDDTTKEESIELVKRIFEQWQIPIIFVTHSNYEATSLAHEVINIK
ncbi:ATP-binding cassette domain-containing protein [Staphylococcus pseudoxylosus]|uniref:ATP-binding cassette domain-containing protein n=1 Tax=Staphylococcus pseudoxylosus TaxID=2282419 RepID=UPI000D1DCBFD|nr:ATP-binding cassette domain-containing protein [Staphylococcus pseudoxylosus]PTI57528.1 molybdenum ABC transporter ATP-binding protein [Staphylococcus xylosus]MEB6037676.1 ATP-binding cassette domain-containing protein [Staphylococcus pseudoxylosus]MEB7754138.1 ATP-binding cassette domain-containing protein [Staphylococcus pseudoxylosus]MEB7764905.1 ATP-binding cassette domain-containing protein [Staphylococcus pseudoxylosus]MEB8087804.1 ATP-binding cassette domain-containing protein [Staph